MSEFDRNQKYPATSTPSTTQPDMGVSDSGGSSSSQPAAPESFQAGSSHPSESWYTKAEGAPGFTPQQTKPQPQPNLTLCRYQLPIVVQGTYYASTDPAQRDKRKYCTNPSLLRSNPSRCIAHVGKNQFFYQCQAKVYILDAKGEILWDENGPVVEQEPIGYGASEDKICRNPIVSEKFFCDNCRPNFLPCSFGVAFPGACNQYAQPDEPWITWANCWAHHGNPNKVYEPSSPGGNFGWPENRLMLATNPAPTGISKKSGRTGQKRGNYQSGIGYETVTRGTNADGFIIENPPQDAQRRQEQRKQAKKKDEEERNMVAEASREALTRFSDNLNSLDKHSYRTGG
ncbi:hypothetical protein MFRU_008g03160 [Monilinia fructicola]|nr:hypothetical protein MFRU_008g03160 [Monilinia fructicola]